jgi:hypothetical protein
MKKSIALLRNGFESSSGTTQEFLNFYRTFKSEFTKELLSIGATDIQIGKGHFYVSGFFTVDGQVWYFSLSDVRGMEYCLNQSCMGKLLYRTAKNNKDFTGGYNRYATIETGMAQKMCWSFKIVE